MLKQIGRYIKEIVYGANDGLITTFAVIASVIGANLETKIILIVGSASLVADGLSMAASSYLANKSERSMQKAQGEAPNAGAAEHPAVGSIFTLVAFVAVGFLPLLPFLIIPESESVVVVCAVATAFALFIIGAMRTFATRRHWLRSGIEMLLVGGGASAVAFYIARYVSSLT